VEINEDRLAGLGAQISDVLIIEHGTDKGLHHQIELSGLGQLFGAAVGASGGVSHLIHAVT